jgi:hypothetical protein
MGATCNRFSKEDDQGELIIETSTYKDFTPKRYSSQLDHYFNTFEEKINLLKYINVIQFASSLSQFKFESNDLNANKSIETKSTLFTEVINSQDLMLFIENKIIKHHYIYDLEIPQDIKEISTEFFLKLHETIRKGYLSYVKLHNSQNQEQLDKKPKKFFFLALGILLCGGDNLAKIDIIFSLFANEVNRIERKNQMFNIFVFVTFLTASYAIFKNIDDFSPLQPELFHFYVSEEEKSKLYEKFDLQRIIKLKDNFIDQLFGMSKTISYYEYRDKIIHDQHDGNDRIDWFLTSSGIRAHLDTIL